MEKITIVLDEEHDITDEPGSTPASRIE